MKSFFTVVLLALLTNCGDPVTETRCCASDDGGSSSTGGSSGSSGGNPGTTGTSVGCLSPCATSGGTVGDPSPTSGGATGASSSGGSSGTTGSDSGWSPGDAGWVFNDGGLSCTPATTDCENPTTEVICNQNGTSTREVPCPNGCNGTSCDTCQSGFSQCQNGNVTECNSDDHSSSVIQPCLYGCDPTSVTCYPTCAPTTSLYTDLPDGGGEVVTCNQDGTAYDAGINICPFGGANIDGGIACYTTCFPGTFQCGNTKVLECNSFGTGFDGGEQVCSDHCGPGIDGGLTCDFCNDPTDCLANIPGLTTCNPGGPFLIPRLCVNNLCVPSLDIQCNIDGGCPIDSVCFQSMCQVHTCDIAEAGPSLCKPFDQDAGTCGLILTNN